jgi:hypothetical protein
LDANPPFTFDLSGICTLTPYPSQDHAEMIAEVNGESGQLFRIGGFDSANSYVDLVQEF